MRRIFHLVLLGVSSLVLTAPALADCPTGFALVQASKIQDLSAVPLASGAFSITAVDANRQQINFGAPGGGATIKAIKKSPVANGAITNQVCVPRSDLSSVYVRYHIVINDTSSGGSHSVVLDANDIAITTDVFSLDSYNFPANAYANPPNVLTTSTLNGDLHVTGTIYGGTISGATAVNATHAVTADTATTAVNATTATTASHATTADSATTATSATTAATAAVANTAVTANTASALAATPTDCGSMAANGINADGSPKSCISTGGGTPPAGTLNDVQVKGSSGLSAIVGFKTNPANNEVTAQITNGEVNSDKFISAGNDGAVNTFSNSTACPSGHCAVVIPPTSTSAENPPMPPSGATLYDRRGATELVYAHNPTSINARYTLGVASFQAPKMDISIFDGAVTGFALGRYSYYKNSQAGWNYGSTGSGGWGGGRARLSGADFYTAGINQVDSFTGYCHGVGDCANRYHELYWPGGIEAGSDEGDTLDTAKGGNPQTYTTTTITATTGTGDQTPTVAAGPMIANGTLLATGAGSSAMHITGVPTAFGTGVNHFWSYPVDVAQTPSTYGQLACGLSTSIATAYSITGGVVTFTSNNSWLAGDVIVIPGGGQAPYVGSGPFTDGMQFTVSSTGLSSTSFQAATSLPNGSGSVSTGFFLINPNPTVERVVTCPVTIQGGTAFATGYTFLQGAWFPEDAKITAVGTPSGGVQSVTISYLKPNPTGLYLFQGGPAGRRATGDYATSLNSLKAPWYVAGAIDSSHLVISSLYYGDSTQQPFQPMAFINDRSTVTALGTATSNGTTITAGTSTNATFNQRYVGALSVTLSGCSNSGFNGTVTPTLSADQYTMTFPIVVAAGTATGCQLDLGPSYYAIHTWYGTQIEQTPNGLLGKLAPNNIPFTIGMAVESPFPPSQAGWVNHRGVNLYTLDSRNTVDNRWLSGPGWSGFAHPDEIRIGNPCTIYIGCNGQLGAMTVRQVFGPAGIWWHGTAPVDGSPMFYVGARPNPTGDSTDPNPISVFWLPLTNGAYGVFKWSPVTGTFSTPNESTGNSTVNGTLNVTGAAGFTGGINATNNTDIAIPDNNSGKFFVGKGSQVKFSNNNALIQCDTYSGTALCLGTPEAAPQSSSDRSATGILHVGALNSSSASTLSGFGSMTANTGWFGISLTGALGSTYRTYVATKVTPDGFESTPSIFSQGYNVSPAVLDSSNKITLTCYPSPEPGDPSGTTYKFYETFSNTYIGTCAPGGTVVDTGQSNSAGTAYPPAIPGNMPASASIYKAPLAGSFAFYNFITGAVDSSFTLASAKHWLLGNGSPGNHSATLETDHIMADIDMTIAGSPAATSATVSAALAAYTPTHTPIRYVGTVTLTASGPDSASITGITSSMHCTASYTTTTGTMVPLGCVATTGTVTVNHSTATAGDVVSIFADLL